MKQPKKPMSKASPPLEFTSEEYLEFLQSIQLKGLGVDQASFSVQRSLILDAVRQGQQMEGGFVTNFSLNANEANHFIVSAATEVKQKSASGVADIISINCVFTALFECKSDALLSLREHFSQNQAKIVMWPYIRQFVTDSSNHMSVSQILLPLTIVSGQPSEPVKSPPTGRLRRKEKQTA